MKTNIFVNLPVRDLEKSKKFFAGLGYAFNPQFTNDKAACMIIEDNIYVMLVSRDFFKVLTKKKILDAHMGAESTTCLSAESKEKVDDWIEKALSMGASENIIPEMQTGETMYGRSINDPDGHIWEIMWMDPKVIQKK